MIFRLIRSLDLWTTSSIAISVLLLIKYFGGTGDIYLYINAGEKILNGVNPYLDSEYANSPVAAVVVLLVSKLFPGIIFPLVIQTLNLVGIVYFIKIHKDIFSSQLTSGLIMCILALSVSYRALISNVQVTGLVLGLYSLAVFMHERKSHFSKIVSFLLIGLAVELKPQLALPFALIFVLRRWNLTRVLTTIFVFLFVHLGVSVFYGAILELLWIDKINQYSSKSFLPGPEISPFKFIGFFVDQHNLLKIVGLLVLLTIYLVLLIGSKTSHKEMLLVASMVPFLSSYSHMYDFIPLIVIVGLGNFIDSNRLMVFIIAMIIPPNLNMTSILFVSISMILGIGIYLLKNSQLSKIRYLFFSIYCVFLLVYSRWFSPENVELEMSVRLTLLLPIFLNYLFSFSKLFLVLEKSSLRIRK